MPSTGTSRMRAVVLTAPRTPEIVQIERPVAAADQVLIRIEGSGLCGSNLPLWQGRSWFQYPTDPGAPGHEGWGTVESIGRDVRGLAVGDRVAAVSYKAFAEYDVADASACVLLPDALRGRDVPGEALACAVNVVGRSDIRAGQVVAVVGIGFLGAVAVQRLARMGAQVIAISRRPFSLEVARKMGARHVLSSDDPDSVVAQVEGLTGGRLCDVVIEATGLAEPLALAARLTRVRGRLVIAGFHQDGPRQVDMTLWNWRGLDVINAHERETSVYAEGLRRAVAAMTESELDPAPLLTHRFDIESIAQAFQALEDRPDGFMKAEMVLR